MLGGVEEGRVGLEDQSFFQDALKIHLLLCSLEIISLNETCRNQIFYKFDTFCDFFEAFYHKI